MKWFGRAVLVVAVLGVAAAPAGAAPRKLKTEVLTISQVPKGFLAEAASSTEIFGCGASAFPTGWSAKATAGFNFKSPKAFPLISEVLATFPNAVTTYNDLIGGVAGCVNLNGTQDGRTYSGSIAKIPMNSYGDQSIGFQGHFFLNGTAIVLDVVVVRKGSDVMELEEANYTGVKTGGFEAIAAAAVSKF